MPMMRRTAKQKQCLLGTRTGFSNFESRYGTATPQQISYTLHHKLDCINKIGMKEKRTESVYSEQFGWKS